MVLICVQVNPHIESFVGAAGTPKTSQSATNPQPKRRKKVMTRRTNWLVKPGMKYVIAARFPSSARVGYGMIMPASAAR
jgi:hypothetical protein